MAEKNERPIKVIAENRKARFNYAVEDTVDDVVGPSIIRLHLPTPLTASLRTFSPTQSPELRIISQSFFASAHFSKPSKASARRLLALIHMPPRSTSLPSSRLVILDSSEDIARRGCSAMHAVFVAKDLADRTKHSDCRDIMN